jgi:hypothetical protein
MSLVLHGWLHRASTTPLGWKEQPAQSSKQQRWPMVRWSVDLIRNRAQRLGTVVANTEKEAIAVAIKQFEIEPAHQNRISVTKISDKNDTEG